MEAGAAAVRALAYAGVIVAVQAVPAAAQTMLAIDFPAGSAGQQLLTLGTQARVGISVPMLAYGAGGCRRCAAK